MKKQRFFFIGSLLAMGIAFTACNSNPKSNDTEKSDTMVAEKGAHERDDISRRTDLGGSATGALEGRCAAPFRSDARF